MVLINEKKRKSETYYEVETYNQKNELIDKEIVYLKSAIFEHENKFTYFILYDETMIPIREVFRFLNYELATTSINTREKSLHALKLLYIFKRIINKDIKNFNKTDISNLKNFLRGFSPNGQVMSFNLITERNFETINGYLSIYRNYMRFLNLSESSFLKKSERQTKIFVFDNDLELKVNPYESTEKAPSGNIEVPKYISVKEFRNIINIVRSDYTKREECIIRLMYQCGLRIGEVLGLTADDVIVEELREMEKIEDRYIAVAYLRNRLSDKKDQKAKTCMEVKDRKQYRLKEYNTKNKGYQRVIIPMDLYELINEYIDEVHISARENKYDNYYKYTIADRVRKPVEDEDDNYYIFLNSQGRPLLSHLWNFTMREIFEKANISVDKDVKESNLNHRFRHGFAMFQVKYLNVKMLELQKKLRHRSLMSVYCYYQPTISDEIELKTEFCNDLYSIIPELNIKKKGI